jgi:hypothetical protein
VALQLSTFATISANNDQIAPQQTMTYFDRLVDPGEQGSRIPIGLSRDLSDGECRPQLR